MHTLSSAFRAHPAEKPGALMQAATGGAVYIKEAGAVMSGGSFTGNTATGNGGAVHHVTTRTNSKTALSIKGVTFSSNEVRVAILVP